MSTSYNALIDAETNVLLAMGTSVPAVVFLTECIPDSIFVTNVQRPGLRLFTSLLSLGAIDIPAWAWDRKKRILVPTKKGILTDALRTKSLLAVAKLNAIDTMLVNLNIARFRATTGLLLQESVYLTKRIEAAAFKNSGYDESRIMEFPCVLQYADFAGIDLRQAADDILFKAQISQDALAKTELLRLRNFNRIKEARSPDDVADILKAFFLECYGATI